MDIGGLMRSVSGDGMAEGKQASELKPGQIVRGIVLQMFADNEALLQIGGIPVRAKLEAPVQAGSAALFQVQSDVRKGDQLLVRPLPSQTTEFAPESLAGVLKSFGMKDTPLNRSILHVLHEEGAPMSRAANAAVAAAVKELAPSGDAEPLLRAAAIAVKRGVPVSAETVRALHTAMAGPPPSELFRALEAGARDALAAPGSSAAVRQAAERLLGVLQRADALLGMALQPETAEGPGGAFGLRVPQPLGQAPVPMAPAADTAAPSAAEPAPAPGQPPAAAQTGRAPVMQAAAADGAEAPDRAAASGNPSAPAPPPGPLKLTAVPPSREGLSQAPATTPKASAEPAAAGTISQHASLPPTSPEPAAATDRPPLLQLLKLIGVDAEREWLKLAAAVPQGGPKEEGPPMHAPQPAERSVKAGALPPELRFDLLPDDLPEPAQAARSAERAQLDTLKSSLVQLLAADDAPPLLRETAQTALQSVTGQQLLMAQDRTVPFAHVTMFVPLPGKGGKDGNAAVHIHTRRGKQGGLDADNCRLWFQLDLASMGETWLDVNVTNRIVGLHVWNDHPAAPLLLNKHKGGMEAALKGIGYHLLTFKHSTRPKEAVQERAETADGMPPGKAIVSAFAPQAYKGVDLRI